MYAILHNYLKEVDTATPSVADLRVRVDDQAELAEGNTMVVELFKSDNGGRLACYPAEPAPDPADNRRKPTDRPE